MIYRIIKLHRLKGGRVDIIIPTMWRKPEITIYALRSYLSISEIKKIIIIDNDRNKRPKINILNSPKIKFLDFKKNIYVNPSWNKGVEEANNGLICLCNDDIIIDRLIIEVINLINFTDKNEIELIGIRGKDHNGFMLSPFKIDKTKNLGIQCNGLFGMAMFLKKENYKPIPDDLKVWFGDDYLVRNSKNVFTIPANRFRISMGSTIKSLKQEGEEISNVIKQDINNWLLKYK